MNVALVIGCLFNVSILYYISTHLFHLKKDHLFSKLTLLIFLFLREIYQEFYILNYKIYSIIDLEMFVFVFIFFCLFEENPVFIYVINFLYIMISIFVSKVVIVILRMLFHIPSFFMVYGNDMSIGKFNIFCISLGVEALIEIFLFCRKRPFFKSFKKFSFLHLFLGYHIFYVFFSNLLTSNFFFVEIRKTSVIHLMLWIFILIMFILAFFSFLFFGFFENYYCKKKEKQCIEKQKQTIMQHYHQYQNIYSQYYKLNHDYKNHMAISLQNKNYNRLMKQKYEALYQEFDLIKVPEMEIYDDTSMRKINIPLYIIEIIIYIILVLLYLNGNLMPISLFVVLVFLIFSTTLYFSVYKKRKVENDIQIMQQKMKSVSLESDHQQMKSKMKKLLNDFNIQTKDSMEFSILDILIGLKMNRMEELSIDHDIQVSLPYDCFLENMDSISLFSNLLDNAIEACQCCDSKNIVMKVKYKKGMICIYMENSLPANYHPVDDQFQSQKEDYIHHGWGMKIINEIVEKYNGEMIFEEKENTFITRIIL